MHHLLALLFLFYFVVYRPIKVDRTVCHDIMRDYNSLRIIYKRPCSMPVLGDLLIPFPSVFSPSRRGANVPTGSSSPS